MEERILNVGDTIYVMFTPNNTMKYYRYYKCTITYLQLGWGVTKNINRPMFQTYNLNDLKELEKQSSYSQNKNLLTIGIQYVINNANKPVRNFILLNKDKHRIYFEDEVDIVEKDVENLNKILELKIKQKQELQEYTKTLLTNWNYRGKDNLL